MKTSNMATGNQNIAESGHVWREKITNNMEKIQVKPRTIFRVRATAGTEVKIDGELAMTMDAGEIAIFNAGEGKKGDGKAKVEIELATAAGWLQIADDTVTGR